MWKGLLYSIITITLYFLIISGFSHLFEFIFTRDYFLYINDSYLLFLDSITYLILIFFVYLFIKITRKNTIEKNKITLIDVLKILFLVLIFRLTEDPLFNIDIILKKEDIPIIKGLSSTSSVEVVSGIFGVIILGPIFEELLFRQIILNFFKTRYLVIGVIVSSLLFALIHVNFSYINYITLISSFVFGIITCIIYLKKGVFYAIIFHIWYNLLWFIIQEYKQIYWNLLKELNFGVIYWIIIIGSIIIILKLTYNNIIKLKLINQNLKKS